MNGLLELYRRNSAEADMNFDNPQCFSLTVNNAFVSVNIHWLSYSAEDGSICFRMASLSKHFTDSDGLKLVQKIVKNILDYAVSKQLPKICEENILTGLAKAAKIGYALQLTENFSTNIISRYNLFPLIGSLF